MILSGVNLSQQVYIIAELSANHNQDFTLAKEGIRLAKEAGANAVKLQTYTPDSLTIDVKTENFKAGFLWSDEYLYDLYQRACMPYEWHKPLYDFAQEIGITLFSTPFDHDGLALLESLDFPIYKIASFEITDIPLIKAVAKLQKPIIISTGVATHDDITLALETCYNEGNKDIILLKCTSEYPAPPESMNLATIPNMGQKYNVITGISDHSMGNEACIAAVALGARVIEKHFTPNKSIPSADAAFSLDPTEFASMVKAVRNVEKMVGVATYEGGSKKFARSLYVVEDIMQGEALNPNNIRSIRPGNGLHPRYYEEILGKKATKNLLRGEPLNLDSFEP